MAEFTSQGSFFLKLANFNSTAELSPCPQSQLNRLFSHLFNKIRNSSIFNTGPSAISRAFMSSYRKMNKTDQLRSMSIHNTKKVHYYIYKFLLSNNAHPNTCVLIIYLKYLQIKWIHILVILLPGSQHLNNRKLMQRKMQ